MERGRRDAESEHDDDDEIDDDVTSARSRLATFVAAVAVAGCASGAGDGATAARDQADGGIPYLAPAPWSGASIDPALVPQPYLIAWNAADNRGTCALLAPRHIERSDATARRATFGGGWGVAYDLPDLRSAFGVAGTGASASGDTYGAWPHRTEWTDGSRAGYGPEGGSGPNQLAYVTIPGQTCLYNVWSRLGVDHLERLIDQLRFVE